MGYASLSSTQDSSAAVHILTSGSRTAFSLVGGGALLLTQNHAGTEVYVYEANAARTTETLRATLTAPGGAGGFVTGAMFLDGSLGIVWRTANFKDIWYRKVTITTWALSAWEKVLPTITANALLKSVDVDVSDSGAVAVAFSYFAQSSTGSTSNLVYVKATTGGAWVQTYNIVAVTGGFAVDSADTCAVLWVGALASGIRNMVIAFGNARVGVDSGVRVNRMRVTEATGAQSGASVVVTTSAAGEAETGSSSTSRRLVSLFRGGGAVGDHNIAISHTAVNRLMVVIRGNLSADGQTYTISSSTKQSVYSTAQTFGIGHSSDANNVNFYSINLVGSLRSVRVVIAKRTTAWTWSGDYEYFPASTNQATYIGGGGKRNNGAIQNYHDITIRSSIFIPQISVFRTYNDHAWVGIAGSGITRLLPAQDQGVSTATPSLTADADINVPRGQSKYRVVFQFATESGFNTGFKEYLQPEAKANIIDGTQVSNNVVTINDVLTADKALNGANFWYYRASLQDEWGNRSSWTGTQLFVIGHPPRGVLVSFNNGGLYNWNGGNIGLEWVFTDPSSTDYQSAYQVLISDDANNVIQDTGKVTGNSKIYFYTVPAMYKDQTLNWKVKLWDSEDTTGAWSDVGMFTLSDPPSVVMNFPTANQVVTTGVPTFDFTMTTGGTRKIKEYTIVLSQNGIALWSSRTPGPWNSGTTLQRKLPPNILNNNQAYTVSVSILDDANLQNPLVNTPFSVAWVPPAAPNDVNVNVTLYNTDDDGYVFVTWSDAVRDVDFAGWAVYRKDDLISPHDNSVLEPGSYNLIYMEYNTLANYEYRDYFAPAGYKVTYLVKQLINRDGQNMDSGESNAVPVIPISDGYWLIEPNSDNTDADAFKLSIVTGHDFVDEYEEEVMVIIGKGRVVNKGQDLGESGSLAAQIRDTGGTSARQKRMRLKEIKRTDSQLWLRTPFGDTFRVNVGNMSISRIAGVGRSEFIDVEIPYSEVAE